VYESVTFDDRGITSIDWQTYPILRFNSVPDSIEVHAIDRPGQPFLGSGEAGQGPAALRTPLPTPPASGYATCLGRGNGSRMRLRREHSDSLTAGRTRPVPTFPSFVISL
jgi:hypothetical protein